MSTTLQSAVESYARARNLSRGTRNEYAATVKKWTQWGHAIPIKQLTRKDVREFLDWVHEQAIAEKGANPGRTANKARENLRVVLSWAWEQDLLETLPRFPPSREQRDVAGRHYLTKSEINALYFATYQLKRPRGWADSFSIGRYWRSALALFFNYGLDTGSIWKSTPIHEPILWRHISWDQHASDGLRRKHAAGVGSIFEG